MSYWNFGNNEYVLAVWPDAEDLDPLVYEALFSTANAICLAYAPVLSEGAAISDSYKLAEVITARDIASKMTGGNVEAIGYGEQEVRVFPLNYLARDLLRPKTNPIARLR